jgi:hypothetical protein
MHRVLDAYEDEAGERERGERIRFAEHRASEAHHGGH